MLALLQVDLQVQNGSWSVERGRAEDFAVEFSF